MPTLSISVSSSTVASGTRTYNITDADLSRRPSRPEISNVTYVSETNSFYI
jgi:hypothetical protein